MSELKELPEGWVWTELSDWVWDSKNEVVDGPFGSNLKASEYVSDGIPIIRIQNVQRNQFINKNIKYVTTEKAQQLVRHSFQCGDIAITKLGAPLGRACIIPNYLEQGIIVADIVRIRFSNETLSEQA